MVGSHPATEARFMPGSLCHFGLARGQRDCLTHSNCAAGRERMRSLGMELGIVIALLSLGSGCQKVDSASVGNESQPAPPSSALDESPWFIDITDKVGLNFVHDAGPLDNYFFPELLGSGAALFDFDNDGRLDIYLLQ